MHIRVARVLRSAAAGAAVMSLGVVGGADAASAARQPAHAEGGLQDAAAGATGRVSPVGPPASRGRTVTAYIVNADSGTVTPIDTATGTPGTPITVGSDPQHIAVAPNGKTAYVANDGTDTVTPIRTATNTAGTPITVGDNPLAIAIIRRPRAPHRPAVQGTPRRAERSRAV